MALLWKMICNLGDPMSLRHPVPHAIRVNNFCVGGTALYKSRAPLLENRGLYTHLVHRQTRIVLRQNRADLMEDTALLSGE